MVTNTTNINIVPGHITKAFSAARLYFLAQVLESNIAERTSSSLSRTTFQRCRSLIEPKNGDDVVRKKMMHRRRRVEVGRKMARWKDWSWQRIFYQYLPRTESEIDIGVAHIYYLGILDSYGAVR